MDKFSTTQFQSQVLNNINRSQISMNVNLVLLVTSRVGRGVSMTQACITATVSLDTQSLLTWCHVLVRIRINLQPHCQNASTTHQYPFFTQILMNAVLLWMPVSSCVLTTLVLTHVSVTKDTQELMMLSAV